MKTKLQVEVEAIAKRYDLETPRIEMVEEFEKARVVGRAHLEEWYIEIRSTGQSEEQQLETLRHEMAHLIAFDRDGVFGHNRFWRKYARQLGAHPRACHTEEQQLVALSKRSWS